MPINATEDADLFLRLISEAATWCLTHGDLGDPIGGLRLPDLEPAAFYDAPHEERHSIVEALVATRASRLQATGITPEIARFNVREGRILVCAGDTEDKSEGMCEHESDGFFDEYDLPPWDTWLCYVNEPDDEEPDTPRYYLLSWVPAELMDLAHKGIEAHGLGSAWWARSRNDL